MTPFLQAGSTSWITWTQLWVAIAFLHLYTGAGIWWAFRIKRKRDARLGLARPTEREDLRCRRGLARFLDEVYALSTLRERAARSLALLRSRMRTSVAARRTFGEGERAPAA
jgi:hypothetical protein